MRVAFSLTVFLNYHRFGVKKTGSITGVVIK